MSKLYLLCGVPGSGKSTWVQKQIDKHNEQNESCIWHSRDAVRFSLLKEDEDYFAKEDMVIAQWLENIQTSIGLDVEHIYVDATHLSPKAREKVLSSLCLTDVAIIPVNFLIPLDTCLGRNELRKGIGRTYVPCEVIRRMYHQFKPATHKEKFIYSEIIEVKE